MNIEELKNQIAIEEHRTPSGLIQFRAVLVVQTSVMIPPKQLAQTEDKRTEIRNTLKNDLVHRMISLGKELESEFTWGYPSRPAAKTEKSNGDETKL